MNGGPLEEVSTYKHKDILTLCDKLKLDKNPKKERQIRFGHYKILEIRFFKGQINFFLVKPKKNWFFQNCTCDSCFTVLQNFTWIKFLRQIKFRQIELLRNKQN